MRIKKSSLSIFFGIIFLFLLLGPISSACAETFVLQVKAAFVMKIVDFVEWTNEENKNFAVSILGDEGLIESFKSLGVNKAKGKNLVLKRYNLNDEDKEKCHVFFISKLMEQKLPDILAKFENAFVLLIGDNPNFTQMGGMISLVESKGKLGMEINLKRVKKIEGEIQLLSRTRLLDTLNREEEPCIALGKAKIYSIATEKLLFQSNFLALNKDQIVMIAESYTLPSQVQSFWNKIKPISHKKSHSL